MFPVNSDTLSYDKHMLDTFDNLINNTDSQNNPTSGTTSDISWNIRQLLPDILVAGDDAGYLTKEGALLLDPSGILKPGCMLCPPEGDAGTGMTATNSVRQGTGNVSAGTSIFSMVV